MMREEIQALGAARRLSLHGGSLPVLPGVPALTDVGHGTLVPGNLHVRLPWSQQP